MALIGLPLRTHRPMCILPPVFLNKGEPMRPPRPPQITPPSPSHAPNFTPTNKPNFIPPPHPFNFVIDFGD